MNVLEKISYGDFDVMLTTPILVSENHEKLLGRLDELNRALTYDEIDDGVRYRIAPYKVTVI